jgi:hypothetical protein
MIGTALKGMAYWNDGLSGVGFGERRGGDGDHCGRRQVARARPAACLRPQHGVGRQPRESSTVPFSAPPHAVSGQGFWDSAARKPYPAVVAQTKALGSA